MSLKVGAQVLRHLTKIVKDFAVFFFLHCWKIKKYDFKSVSDLQLFRELQSIINHSARHGDCILQVFRNNYEFWGVQKVFLSVA